MRPLMLKEAALVVSLDRVNPPPRPAQLDLVVMLSVVMLNVVLLIVASHLGVSIEKH